MEEVSQPWIKRLYHMSCEDLFPPLSLSFPECTGSDVGGFCA